MVIEYLQTRYLRVGFSFYMLTNCSVVWLHSLNILIIMVYFIEHKLFKEEKKNKKSAKNSNCCSTHDDVHSDDDGHNHEHNAEGSTFKMFLPAIISFLLLLVAIAFDNYIPQEWFKGYVRLAWYIVAYLPVGIPVLKEAFESITKGDVFSEFLLMCIATLGAFAIGEYPEGVAVML